MLLLTARLCIGACAVANVLICDEFSRSAKNSNYVRSRV